MFPSVRLSTVLRVGLAAALLTACGPKASPQRRVVTGVVSESSTETPPDQVDPTYNWATGARHFEARDPAGSPRVAWRVDLGTPLVHPLMTDGSTVYGAGSGEVFAVAADGTERWRARVDATGGVSVREAGVAVPTTRDTVVELDRDRGTITRTHVAGGVVTGHPVPLLGELLWVTDNGEVIADAGWMAPGSDSAIGTPSSDEEHIYFGTRTGEVVAASRARARWRTVLPGPVVGGLVSADGMVFAAYVGELGRPGGVVAIAADSGTVAWRIPLNSDPASGPALGRLVVVPDRSGEIVGLDPATGDVMWRAEVAGSPSTTPAFGEFGLYVGNADGRLHRLDPDDGGEIWSIDLGATPSASPVVLPGQVVVGLSDGSLVAVGGQ